MLHDYQRIQYLKVSVVLAILAGVLFFPDVWFSLRKFPTIPLFSFLPPAPFLLELVLLVMIIILLLAIIIKENPRKYIIATISLIVLVSLWDQMRWSPWLYQYVFLLVGLSFYTWNKRGSDRKQLVLDACRIIIASVYIWSGLHKINSAFLGHVFPWLTEPFISFLPQAFKEPIFFLGIFVPFIEAGIGLGLLARQTRKVAIYSALIMHGFILLALGPLGHGWAHNIWPWNIAMMAFVIILFWGYHAELKQIFASAKKFLVGKVILVLFILMPILSFFNLWDTYLSADMYSGHTSYAIIIVNNELKSKLPAAAQKHISSLGNGKHELNIFNWAVAELNYSPYPATRVYKGIAQIICSQFGSPTELILRINKSPSWFQGPTKLTQYNCSNL